NFMTPTTPMAFWLNMTLTALYLASGAYAKKIGGVKGGGSSGSSSSGGSSLNPLAAAALAVYSICTAIFAVLGLYLGWLLFRKCISALMVPAYRYLSFGIAVLVINNSLSASLIAMIYSPRRNQALLDSWGLFWVFGEIVVGVTLFMLIRGQDMILSQKT